MKKAIFAQNNRVLRLTVPVAQWAWRRPDVDLIDGSLTPTFDIMSCGVEWEQYDNVVIIGSTQLIDHCRMTTLSKHIRDSTDALNALDWQADYPAHMVNVGVVVNAEFVPSLLAYGPHHIRPLIQSKRFNGNLYTTETWSPTIEGDVDCYVSPPAQIVDEYRCWIIDNELCEASQYLSNGEYYLDRVTHDSELWNVLDCFVKRLSLRSSTMTMDVTITSDGPKIIEFNSIHSSGWYHADVNHILTKLVYRNDVSPA